MSGHRIPPMKGGMTHFYTATKYAVTAITEATRRELREMKTHIRIAVSTTGVCCRYHSLDMHNHTAQTCRTVKVSFIFESISCIIGFFMCALSPIYSVKSSSRWIKGYLEEDIALNPSFGTKCCMLNCAAVTLELPWVIECCCL